MQVEPILGHGEAAGVERVEMPRIAVLFGEPLVKITGFGEPVGEEIALARPEQSVLLEGRNGPAQSRQAGVFAGGVVPPAADGNGAALAAAPSDDSPDDIIAVLDADARIASEFLRQATGTWSTAMWPSPPGAG